MKVTLTNASLPQNATKQMVEGKIQDHILDRADLAELYKRLVLIIRFKS